MDFSALRQVFEKLHFVIFHANLNFDLFCRFSVVNAKNPARRPNEQHSNTVTRQKQEDDQTSVKIRPINLKQIWSHTTCWIAIFKNRPTLLTVHVVLNRQCIHLLQYFSTFWTIFNSRPIFLLFFYGSFYGWNSAEVCTVEPVCPQSCRLMPTWRCSGQLGILLYSTLSCPEQR